MGKQKMRKGIRTVAGICSMFILAFLFVLTDAEKAKAFSYKRVPGDDRCSLYSVTFEVGGKEYAGDGSLNYIPVAPDVDWKEYFKTFKITDYKVLVDDGCSHVEDHKSISACVGYGYGTEWLPFYTYKDDGNGGTNTNPDVEKDLSEGAYEVRFYLDDNKDAYIRIPFQKECQISYELNGGSFPEGLTVPKTISAVNMRALCSPVKSGSQFLGWKEKGESGDYCDRYVYWDGTGEAPTYVACWDDSTDPIDISGIDISISEDRFIFDEEEVTVRLPYIYSGDLKLEEGIHYFLSYRNNDKAATADSSNPPTVIIEGIGKYTGKVERKFSISQFDKLYLPYYRDEDDEGNLLHLDVVKGKPLSSIDLSDARVYKNENSSTPEVKGTFSWEKGDYVPDAQVGNVLKNDSEKGETNYNLVFTPDNQNIYSRKVFTEGVYITVKQGSIEDCQITFESGKHYLFTGESIKPDVIVKDGETVLEKGTDYELSYAGYIKVAGSTDTYAPAVTIKGINSYIGTKKVTYTISMSPEAPVLTAVNETIKGKNDGSITGLEKKMEYRAAVPSVGENTGDFTSVTDTSMTLPAGAYEVRYKAEGIYDPSPVTTVVIQQGRALTLTLPAEQTGYTLTATENQLSWQGTTTLTLTVAPGYTKTKDFALEANVNIVDNKDGTYTISGVTEDVTVTVKGIADVTPPTAKIDVGKCTSGEYADTVEFNTFYRTSADVTITAEDVDTGSGIASIRYYVTDHAMTKEAVQALSEEVWKEYTSRFSLRENGRYVVYAKVADSAGNETIINAGGMVIYRDSEQSTKNISYTRTTKESVTARVSLNGNTIKGVSIKTEATQPVQLNKGSNYTLNETGDEITLDGNYLETLAAGDYMVLVSYHPLGLEYVQNPGEDGVDSNDAPVDTTVALKVEKAIVTITNISNQDKIYDTDVVKAPTYTYQGDADITVEYKSKDADDSTYTKEAPKDAGNYTVRISAPETDNYMCAFATNDFTIQQAESKVLEPPVAEGIEEGQKLSTSTLSGGKMVDNAGNTVAGSFEWEDGDVTPAVEDSNTTKYTVVFRPQDKNYKEAEIQVELTVTAIPIATPTPTATSTVAPTATPIAIPTVAPTAIPTASPAATEAPIQTATPIIQPTSTPENKQDVTNLSAGTKIKDKEQKAHYVIREEKEGAVEIQYVAPVKKTAKVTIPKTVTLENGTVAKVTSIAPNAFKNNTTLQQITIADTVTTIGKNAFSGCKKLKKITIGKKVTTIGSNAFKNCKNIKTIVITSKKLKNLSKSAFKGITSKTTIKVPASMYKAYKKLLRKCGLKSSVKIKK